MYPTRRHVLALAGAAGAALAGPAIAQSAWPNKPVRFVVPFPPGQAADIFARLMAEKLSEKWKQQVIVENKAGGSGIPATEYGKMAAPDGYTLMVVSSGTFGVNPSLYPDLPYKPLTDFLPISNIFLVPLVIVAHPSLPVNTLAELIALAKKEPGQLSYASAGPGTSQHLAMELFKLKAGVDIVHIPYKGSGPAMADLLGGHVKLMMDSTASALNAIKDGRIKAIAVTTSRPAPPPLDKIPLIAATIPGFNAAGWSGLAAPARTPLEIVAKVSRDLQTLLNDDAVIKQIEQRAALPAPGTPIQFAEFIKNEIDTWGAVVKATGTKPGT
ncbi:MAG: tripartite tricarboxylate transporter substrate binding protein [Reyranella sp.]|uniref:Bug family tripartite tricarboxylate transporter substrate binding protein n=1 Tax=Reyranella sp. TaxID=1929291 RepID=UPI0011FA0AAB|nr:tripartite tricarboxylate transporter substrate binding protein [Reyranella sp.]TAJ89127.1 MAG: tripartite tricarboxylate transporter substrate binding protein [Reyranella sp.]TBR23901.1 MAG: tripartite tricarboxylate transporter substrate binding protein [Reyranella sp.]